MEFENEIMAYALQNSLEFDKVKPDKILAKLFQHGLEKSAIKEVMPGINEAVKKVNSMSKAKREDEYKVFGKYVMKHEEVERDLPELPNAGKKSVFRLAPFPSGALHLGNAKTYLLNSMYAERYGGKILLIMDDTIGSEEKKPYKEAYELIEDAFKILGVKYEKPIIYKSDRLKIYYEYAEKLIEGGHAYVDYTPAEEMKKMRAEGIESGDRHLPVKIQMQRWKEMFKQKEGEAVLRIKTSMQHPNPAFRDRILFKISEREHPRVGKKYKVWPSLEMTWAIDDHLLGVTHILRGNDLVIESDMERFIWDIFKWKYPEIIHSGLIKFEGAEFKVSKSKSQKEVLSGNFIGWDDPRTLSIQSLVKRGIRIDAIKKFFKEEIGLNKQDITVPIDSLYAINRAMIDAESDRYSFVIDPVELKIKKAIEVKEVEVPIHPDKDETRKLKVEKIYISKKDYQEHTGKEVRLLHLFNVKVKSKDSEITSVDVKKIPKINWVSEFVNASVFMPDGSYVDGFAEKSVEKLKVGQTVQFERFGFVTYQGKKDNTLNFWFAHK